MAGQVVIWSPEALEDVDDIAGYIARDSVFYAAAVVGKMLAAASVLNRFPQSGRIVPELNQSGHTRTLCIQDASINCHREERSDAAIQKCPH